VNEQILVYVDLEGEPCRAGTLWTRDRRGRQSATFEYSPEWLDDPRRFSLEPALATGPGPYHTALDAALFGSFGDSAPDRWGRTLMRREEARRAAAEGRAARTLREIDFLLRVHDATRMGALRFASDESGPFLADSSRTPIPPLVELPRLLSAADRVSTEAETDEDLRLLLAPGSSLGGARPKASVLDARGRLCIAKFPSPTDEWPVVAWEAVALSLAAKAGIRVPQWRLESVGSTPVLLSARFDRTGDLRIPFLSAMSMLGARERETRCYLEMVDALRRWGAASREDARALFRRIVFNVLCTNTDDHLRNHGFLYQAPEGWRLAPVYDLNPTPADVKPRILSTEIDTGDATASLDLALSVAGYFELDHGQARQVAREVGRAAAGWRPAARSLGIGEREIARMESAFEHAELRAALRA
jgi:serine/threonine-protein kinase HipA